MTSVAEVLREARSLIDTPQKWVPYWGEDDGPKCGLHALAVVTGRYDLCDSPGYTELVAAAECGFGSFGFWQDTSSHVEVLAAFDRAIELAETQA